MRFLSLCFYQGPFLEPRQNMERGLFFMHAIAAQLEVLTNKKSGNDEKKIRTSQIPEVFYGCIICDHLNSGVICNPNSRIRLARDGVLVAR